MPKLFRPRKLPVARRPLSQKTWAILHAVDETLKTDAADAMDLKTLRAPLNEIPSAERGVDYAERVIKIYCKLRIKPSRCATLKTQISLLRIANGEQEKFDAFCADIDRILHPETLSTHGFSRSLANLDRNALAAELKQLSNTLTDWGYDHFINSGTLLGAVREGDFIGHDDDVDLGVFVDGNTPTERTGALVKLLAQISEAYHGCETRLSPDGPMVYVKLPSGMSVDLFGCWIENERVFVWPHTYGELERADVFPMTHQPLSGVDFPAPCDPDKMLNINYGGSWRVPDPNFKFSWRAARVKFKSELAPYQKIARKVTPQKRLPFWKKFA